MNKFNPLIIFTDGSSTNSFHIKKLKTAKFINGENLNNIENKIHIDRAGWAIRSINADTFNSSSNVNNVNNINNINYPEMIYGPVNWMPINYIDQADSIVIKYLNNSNDLNLRKDICLTDIQLTTLKTLYLNTFNCIKDIENTKITPTNQRAEGIAMIQALISGIKYIEYNGLINPLNSMVIIYTDSQFYISTITNWMHKWFKIDPEFKTKLDGKPIANKDIICQLYFLWTLLSFYTKVEFKHVRSHQVAPLHGTKEYCIWLNNDIVDKMAKVGASETSIRIKYE